MIKTKLIQTMIFSVVIILLIALGITYSVGLKGPITNDGSLTIEGKLSAGLFSVAFLVLLWQIAVSSPIFISAKGQSRWLKMNLIFSIVMPPMFVISGIIYLSLKENENESLTFDNKKEGA